MKAGPYLDRIYGVAALLNELCVAPGSKEQEKPTTNSNTKGEARAQRRTSGRGLSGGRKEARLAGEGLHAVPFGPQAKWCAGDDRTHSS